MTNPAPSNSNNPFVSLLTADFYNNFTNAIDALLSDCGCTVPCRFVFGGCRFVQCTNCQGGIYKPGGPIPFPNGSLCSLCMGANKINQQTTETFNLAVNFDSKKWRILGNTVSCPTSNTSNSPLIFAETLCRVELYPKVKTVEYIILDCNNEVFMHNRYKRLGEPQPCGLNKMEYILTAWEKIL